MSKNDGPKFIKDPHQKTHFKNDKELEDFIKCCDPVSGHQYFLSNFFNIQHPKMGSMLFQPFPYQTALIDTYHENRFSVALLPRQAGKCVVGGTNITVKNNKTGKQYSLPIEVYYRLMESQKNNSDAVDISEFEVT